MHSRVTVFADLCLDILMIGNTPVIYGQVEQFIDEYSLEVGGSAAIFSAQFKKLGGNPILYGAVGEDAFGTILVNRLQQLSLSTEFITSSKQTKTAVGLGLVNGNDRAMLTYLGSMVGYYKKEILASGILDTTDHLHIVSYYLLEQLQSFWPSILPTLKEKGITISLDTNWAPHGNWETVLDILPYVDVFIPNEQEALHISQATSLDEAGARLNENINLVVIKCGENGASVFMEGSRTDFPVPNELLSQLVIKDTTGAGDNFDAGFIWSWLNKEPLSTCIELGLRCGTNSLKRIGGIDGG